MVENRTRKKFRVVEREFSPNFKANFFLKIKEDRLDAWEFLIYN
jgi:hypothetical protein